MVFIQHPGELRCWRVPLFERGGYDISERLIDLFHKLMMDVEQTWSMLRLHGSLKLAQRGNNQAINLNQTCFRRRASFPPEQNKKDTARRNHDPEKLERLGQCKNEGAHSQCMPMT